MSLADDQAELDQVNAAIAAILSRGQEISIRDNSVRKADLAQLYARKDMLTRRIARVTVGGGIRVRGATPL